MLKKLQFPYKVEALLYFQVVYFNFCFSRQVVKNMELTIISFLLFLHKQLIFFLVFD